MFGNFKELSECYIKFGKWSYSQTVVVPIGFGPWSGVLALTIQGKVRAKIWKLPKILSKAGFVVKRSLGLLALI